MGGEALDIKGHGPPSPLSCLHYPSNGPHELCSTPPCIACPMGMPHPVCMPCLHVQSSHAYPPPCGLHMPLSCPCAIPMPPPTIVPFLRPPAYSPPSPAGQGGAAQRSELWEARHSNAHGRENRAGGGRLGNAQCEGGRPGTPAYPFIAMRAFVYPIFSSDPSRSLIRISILIPSDAPVFESHAQRLERYI